MIGGCQSLSLSSSLLCLNFNLTNVEIAYLISTSMTLNFFNESVFNFTVKKGNSISVILLLLFFFLFTKVHTFCPLYYESYRNRRLLLLIFFFFIFNFVRALLIRVRVFFLSSSLSHTHSVCSLLICSPEQFVATCVRESHVVCCWFKWLSSGVRCH